MSIKPLPSVHKNFNNTTHAHTNKITTTKSNEEKKEKEKEINKFKSVHNCNLPT